MGFPDIGLAIGEVCAGKRLWATPGRVGQRRGAAVPATRSVRSRAPPVMNPVIHSRPALDIMTGPAASHVALCASEGGLRQHVDMVRVWRNRQTQHVGNVRGASPWEFESPHPHPGLDLMGVPSVSSPNVANVPRGRFQPRERGRGFARGPFGRPPGWVLGRSPESSGQSAVVPFHAIASHRTAVMPRADDRHHMQLAPITKGSSAVRYIEKTVPTSAATTRNRRAGARSRVFTNRPQGRETDGNLLPTATWAVPGMLVA